MMTVTYDRYRTEEIGMRESELLPLSQITEVSSFLLHYLAIQKINNEIEITSRSKSFLQEISAFTSRLGIGSLTPGKNLEKPHFRVYLSEKNVDISGGTLIFFTPDLI